MHVVKEIEKEQYQAFWQEHNGSPLQSWYWGEVKKDTWNVQRIGVYENDELVAITTVFLRNFPLSSVIKFLGTKHFAYIPRGICVKSCGNCSGIMRELSLYLSTLHLAFVLVDPDIRFDISNWNKSFKEVLNANGWKSHGVTIEPNQTNVVDISKSEDDLFDTMKPKWRRNVKKALRHGVTVQEIHDNTAIDQFYSILASVAGNTDFKIREKEYFIKMWDKLKQSGLIKVYVAQYKKKMVASYVVLINNYAAYEIYGGATKIGRDVEASYLLKWEIMKQMKKVGKKYYDHWGVAPKGDEKHSLAGISYFKSGFGGEYVQLLPQYVKIYNSFIFNLYKLFSSLLH